MYFFSTLNLRKRVLNVYRNYTKKYGIGSSLAILLCQHTGSHPYSRMRNISYSYLADGVKKLFVRKKDVLNFDFRKVMEDNLMKQVKLNTYKGNCIRNLLPVHGQRRRTNGLTARKLFSKVISKGKKHR